HEQHERNRSGTHDGTLPISTSCPEHQNRLYHPSRSPKWKFPLHHFFTSMRPASDRPGTSLAKGRQQQIAQVGKRTLKTLSPLLRCWPDNGLMALILLLLATTGGPAAEPVGFSRQVRPILSDRCFKCHGPDGNARKRNLRFDVPEGLFKALEDGKQVLKPGSP